MIEDLRIRSELPVVERQVLQVIEEALADHRVFGNSDYILDRFHANCVRRLGIIGSRLGSATTLAERLESAGLPERTRILGNTVVRGAIQHAHVRATGEDYGLPIEDCEEVFQRAVQSLEAGASSFLFEDGPHGLHRLDTDIYRGWVWSAEYPHDVMGRAYRSLIERNWHATLGSPQEDDLAALRQGLELLGTLMPALSRSALRHVHFIGVFDQGGAWRRTASSSTFTVGGTILMARSLLRNPWVLAEHLLHEALHQKLYDFRHGHSLLEPASMQHGAPRILSLWNPAEVSALNSWDVHRAYAAFHVYVQLTVLALIAERELPRLLDRYGPPENLIASQKSFERAWYLGEKLKEEPNWSLLGFAGQGMVDWLHSALPMLELPEPSHSAESHLYLDLYWREARGVLVNEGSPARMMRKLADLARYEIESTRTILKSTAYSALLGQFNDEINQFSNDALGSSFVAIREGIAWTLKNATADGYVLPRAPSADEDPNDQLRHMVLDCSQRLYAILQDIPDSVASAKRRAHELRFGASCLDGVGRLLATLAAAVPPDGRILEIGTGVGVGLAWIVAGLGGRQDVEVVSLEADQQLGEVALETDWPASVHILNADATDLLPTLGSFDLVFVDASPFKHSFIEQCIALLPQRGMLVVDDLRFGEAFPTNPDAAQNKLRNMLKSHPALQAVELDFASGVVLATRAAH